MGRSIRTCAEIVADYVASFSSRRRGAYAVPVQDQKVLVYDGLHRGRHVVSRVHTRVGIRQPHLPQLEPVVNTHTGRHYGHRTVVSNVKKQAMDEFLREKFPHIHTRRGRIRAFEKWHRQRKADLAAAEQKETADVVA